MPEPQKPIINRPRPFERRPLDPIAEAIDNLTSAVRFAALCAAFTGLGIVLAITLGLSDWLR